MLRLPLLLVLLLLFAAASASPMTAADSLFARAENHFWAGAYSEALKLHMQALRLNEQGGDCNRQANSILAVGKMYYYLQQRRTSFAWFRKAFQLANQCQIDSIKTKALIDMGAICTEYGQPDSALFFYSKASALLQSSANKLDVKRKAWMLTNLYCVMAETWYNQKGNKRKGYECVDLAEKASKTCGEPLALSSAIIKRGALTMMDGDCQTAEALFRQALALNQKAGATEEILYAMVLIADASSQCGKAREAYLMMHERQNIRDSIFKAQTAENTARYAVLYETEKKEQRNLLLQKETQLSQLRLQSAVKTRNLILLSAVGGFLLLLLGFFAAYNRYRLKKNKELNERLAAEQLLRFRSVIETEERERARIAREMHDGIGLLLSAARLNISALSPEGEDETTAVNNATSLIDDAVREVRTISHNLMPASLTELGLLPALRELCRKINDAGKVAVTLDIKGEEHPLPDTTAIALYRVAQEAVSNMLRHAQATKIQISVSWQPAAIGLAIADDGVGFNPEAIATSDGIGWKNIFSRIDLLHGKADIQSTPGNGSALHIQVPL